MHTASAVGTKVIAIFGSTVKEFGFIPFNCDHLILENNLLTCLRVLILEEAIA
jgi:heptosyltransferase-2